jgi:hypothetical protein
MLTIDISSDSLPMPAAKVNSHHMQSKMQLTSNYAKCTC